MLGVSDESKAYRLFDPISKKIIVSRDVIFEENKGWNWNMSSEEITSDVLEWGDPKEEIDEAQNAQELRTKDSENERASSNRELGTDANENEEANFKGMNDAGPSGTYAHSSVTHEVNPSVSGRVRQIPP